MRTNGPRGELFLRSDIANAIRAIDSANAELSAAVPFQEVAVYRAGFSAALRAVALAFDIELPNADLPNLPARQWARAPMIVGKVLD